MISPDPYDATLAALRASWSRTDALFARVAPRDLSARPIRQRHPLLFYVGHLPAFAWNQLARAVLRRPPFRREFDQLFAFGIDPEEGAAEDGPSRWPDLDEVLAYRDGVRSALAGCAGELRERAREDPLAAGARGVHLVLEHERMHHETLLYLLKELAPGRVEWPAATTPSVETAGARVPPGRVRIPAGVARLGAEPGSLAFGWDNEFPARTVALGAFEIERLPVTNADYLAFVEADGYADERSWSPAGWRWRQKKDRARPFDWTPDADARAVRTIGGAVPFDRARDWPVCVTWAEADAYARWRGGRLPSEPELVRAAYGTPAGDDGRAYPWGDESPDATRGNLDLERAAPTPVGLFPQGASAFGLADCLGNGWEWTSTPFGPHAGFEPTVPSYAGYSRDFFDGSHYVLRGGSWATDAGLLRRTFRNWFRFDYPYPFTQFRVAYDG